MMKQLLMLATLVALTTLTPWLHVGGASVIKHEADADAEDKYEPLDVSHIDPVDLCLFVCHSCFQQVRHYI